ncbi:MAG: hypothetical protein FWH51_01980 [Dehalococcoidia bacterium]|nr:hypothetical protein [Dehalococcoidia bacterium]
MISQLWLAEYDILKKFISEHPEIEIAVNKTRIPDNARSEFYLHFIQVISSFVNNTAMALVRKSTALSEHYQALAKEISASYGLHISSSPAVFRFLRDPLIEIINSESDLMFDLLKTKISVDIFAELASRKLSEVEQSLFIDSYQQWIALSLLKLLDCQKSLQVVPGSLSRYGVHKSRLSTGNVPLPKESREILFNYESAVKFVVPDFIIYSRRINKYVSFSNKIIRALLKSNSLPAKRQWLSLPPIERIPRYHQMYLYIDDKPEDLRIVADSHNICRPDMILEFARESELKEKLSEAKLQNGRLKPILGTIIIRMEDASGELYSNESGVSIISVGFDLSRLQPVCKALKEFDAR